MSFHRLACNEEVVLGDRGTYRSTCGKESRLECSMDWQLSVGWDLDKVLMPLLQDVKLFSHFS